MGLGSALQVGRSGLLTSQTAVQTAGNNLANLGTRGYHRQAVGLAPAPSRRITNHASVGQGVGLQAITRQVDEALESRLRGALADQSHSTTRHELLKQVESVENDLSNGDLSSRLDAFFNAWSNLANKPQDLSLRTLTVNNAAGLASYVKGLRRDLTDVRAQIDGKTDEAVKQVNSLLTQIQNLNQRIALAAGGGTQAPDSAAPGLADQRDQLLSKLGSNLDISTVTHKNGVTDVFVGSIPIMLNGESRGVELRTRTIDGEQKIDLVTADDKSPLDLSSGKLGALVQFRQQDINQALGALDTFTHQLIGQVNRLHAQGQGLDHAEQITGTARVLDASKPLNDPAAGLNFVPRHGSLELSVTQRSTGRRVVRKIHVDLDGVNPAGDTTADGLAADLDAADHVSARIGADGRLHVKADKGFTISFADDTSGVLGALGVNTFFTGRDAQDIAVNDVVRSNPARLAAASDHRAGDNTNALALAGLRDQKVDALGGRSLGGYWADHVADFASRAKQAKQNADADAVVRDNLEAQQQQVSGVNADEQTINLMQYQRMYQASARFISTVNDLMSTLMNMV